MGIIAKAGPTFVPAPEGQFPAVCADVVDLGMVTTEWNGSKRTAHKIRIVFLISEQTDDGRPFTVSQLFTLSLSEKANLRKFLESWRGRAFTAAELTDGFDIEKLLGADALVQIVHAQKGDKVYANIATIMKAMKGMDKVTIPSDYVRAKDRTEEHKSFDQIKQEVEDEDADLPF